MKMKRGLIFSFFVLLFLFSSPLLMLTHGGVINQPVCDKVAGFGDGPVGMRGQTFKLDTSSCTLSIQFKVDNIRDDSECRDVFISIWEVSGGKPCRWITVKKVELREGANKVRFTFPTTIKAGIYGIFFRPDIYGDNYYDFWWSSKNTYKWGHALKYEQNRWIKEPFDLTCRIVYN